MPKVAATAVCAGCGEVFPCPPSKQRASKSGRNYCSHACRGVYADGAIRRDGEKRCYDCKEWKPLGEFHRQRTSCDGLTQRCKECNCAQAKKWREDNRELVAQRKAQYNKRTYPHLRAKRLRDRFGLTVEQYEGLLAEQAFGCAICGREEPGRTNGGEPGKWLAVDHDEDNGEIRGLLCSQCNKGLGNFGHDIDRLFAAVTYLIERLRSPVEV